jgi:hypothetical protein
VYLQKVCGIKNSTQYPTTVFGSGNHESNEYAMKEKIAGREPKIQKMHQIFQEYFNKHTPEINVWKDEDAKHFIEQGKKAVNDFYYNWVPQLNPYAAELEMLISRGKGKRPIKAFIDLVTQDDNGQPEGIYDYKYGRSSKPVNYLLNMSVYAYGFKQMFGYEPKYVRFLCAKWYQKTVDGKKLKFFKCYEVVELPITPEWETTFLGIMDEVERGIDAGIWLPALDGTGLCKNCGYRLDGHCDVVVLD